MDQFSFQGHWFLPTSEEEKIPGTLKFHPQNGITLDLYNPFDNYSDRKGLRKDIDTILGTTSFGGRITLTNCSSRGWSTSKDHKGEDTINPTYEAEFGFIGEHSVEGPKFHTLHVRFSYLKKWIHRTNLEDFEITLPDGSELSLHYSGVQNPAKSPYPEETGEYRVLFRLNNPVSIQQGISDYIWPFQQIITLGLSSPVFPIEIFGNTSGREQFERNASKFRGHNEDFSFARERTSVVYSEPLRRILPEKEPFGYYTLAHLSDEEIVKEGVGTVIQNWYDTYEDHRPLFDLYFNSVFYNDQPYRSVTLLNLTRGLEAYHRESDQFNHRYISEEEFEEYREELNDTIHTDFPEDFKAHLRRGTFKYANRISLRRRLQDLITTHEDVLNEILNEDFDSREMASDIKEIRNKITHLSNEDISEFDQKAEGSLNRRIRFLIEVIIVDEVGLPNDIFPWYSQ